MSYSFPAFPGLTPAEGMQTLPVLLLSISCCDNRRRNTSPSSGLSRRPFPLLSYTGKRCCCNPLQLSGITHLHYSPFYWRSQSAVHQSLQQSPERRGSRFCEDSGLPGSGRSWCHTGRSYSAPRSFAALWPRSELAGSCCCQSDHSRRWRLELLCSRSCSWLRNALIQLCPIFQE